MKSWAPRLFSPALAFVGQKTTAARIIGIDPVRESRTTTITDKIEQGVYPGPQADHTVMIGGGLAEILAIGVGEEIVLISQAADGSIANDIYRVSAILKGGNDSSDRIHCYMHIEDAQEYLALEGRYHEIAVIAQHHAQSTRTADMISAALSDGGMEVSPWQVVEAEFYRTMVIDKQYSYIMLLIIVVIVALGVLNTVLMSILERTREFGVLKALGTRPRVVFGMIVQETTLLSLLSISVGLVISLGVNWYFTVYGIQYSEPIDVSGFTFTSVNAEMSVGCFFWPSLVTLASALLVSLWPAAKAFRISPVDAMRTN